MVENSKIGRIIFFRIRSSTGYKISENLDRISARRKLCGDSVPCVIWTDALECMGCRTGMWNCISHDIEMVTGGNRVRRQLDDPEYLRHFTLSKYNGTGFTLLNYPDFAKWSALFKDASSLDEGYYMMVSGSRLADGGVLGQVSFFNIRKGEQTSGELLVRDNTEAVKVIGNFDSESKFVNAETGEETTVLKSAGRGLFVLAILGVGQEPTDHTLKDIAVKAKEFDACGRKMILLFPSRAAYEKYLTAPAPGLPEHIVWGIDTDSKIQKQLLEALNLEANTQLPIFIIGDTFNRIVFTSHGYTIGLGERLLKIIDSLSDSEVTNK